MNARPASTTIDTPVLVLTLLLATDAAIIGLDIFTWIAGLKIPFLTIGYDRGLGESFEYIKLFWAVILSAWLAFRADRLGYLVWTLIFAALIADDSLMIHETLGGAATSMFRLTPALGLRATDIGELIAMAGGALLLLPLLVLGYALSDGRVRAVYRRWFPLIVALAFFGVIMDAVHSFFLLNPFLDRLFAIIEDGGELLVISFITASVFDVFFEKPVPPHDKALPSR